MKCKNKEVKVKGLRSIALNPLGIRNQEFDITITNDKFGKTLSICDGSVQFTIPFEPIQKWLS